MLLHCETHSKGILYFVSYEFSCHRLRHTCILKALHKCVQIQGLANVYGDLLAPVQLVRLHIGQNTVHALVPHGHNDRYAWRFIDYATHAPFQTQILLLHVHLALGKHVHPVTQGALLDAQIDCLLVDAMAPHNRYAFACKPHTDMYQFNDCLLN